MATITVAAKGRLTARATVHPSQAVGLVVGTVICMSVWGRITFTLNKKYVNMHGNKCNSIHKTVYWTL